MDAELKAYLDERFEGIDERFKAIHQQIRPHPPVPERDFKPPG